MAKKKPVSRKSDVRSDTETKSERAFAALLKRADLGSETKALIQALSIINGQLEDLNLGVTALLDDTSKLAGISEDSEENRSSLYALVDAAKRTA